MLEVDVRHNLGAFSLEAAFTTGSSGVTALFGRSGSGKTTVVNMLAGLVRPDEGRIVLDGRVLFDAGKDVWVPPNRRRLGYVFQEARLFPHLSVKGNLLYGTRLNPPADDDRLKLAHVVELLDIAPLLSRRPHHLSGGERQRVAIGRALLANPRLLLMDEPLASLDPGRKAEILPFIERLRDDLGLPVIYVSHAVEEIIRLADTVVLMEGGAVAAVGTIEELTSRFDLRPLTGRYEAGAVWSTKVREHDDGFGLTTLEVADKLLRVPMIDVPQGGRVRVRVRARDVAVALTPPADTSVLNILPGTVQQVAAGEGSMVDLLIDVGVPCWARVTARSRCLLGLHPGRSVYVMIKAVAVDRRSMGMRPRN